MREGMIKKFTLENEGARNLLSWGGGKRKLFSYSIPQPACAYCCYLEVGVAEWPVRCITITILLFYEISRID